MSPNKNNSEKEINLLAEFFKTTFTIQNKENSSEVIKKKLDIDVLYPKVSKINRTEEAIYTMAYIKEAEFVRSKLSGNLSGSSPLINNKIKDYETKLTEYLNKQIKEGDLEDIILMTRDFHPVIGKIVQDYLEGNKLGNEDMAHIFKNIKF